MAELVQKPSAKHAFLLYNQIIQFNHEIETNEAYQGVVLSNIYKYIPLWFGGTAYKRFKSWITNLACQRGNPDLKIDFNIGR